MARATISIGELTESDFSMSGESSATMIAITDRGTTNLDYIAIWDADAGRKLAAQILLACEQREEINARQRAERGCKLDVHPTPSDCIAACSINQEQQVCVECERDWTYLNVRDDYDREQNNA
jgi:hypothetical protein